MTIKKSKNARKFLEQRVGKLTFGRFLESIRLGEEQSLTHFAKSLGISATHLCDIEKGRKVVSPERAAKFAQALGYSENQFVRLTLQALVDQCGLKLQVEVKAI